MASAKDIYCIGTAQEAVEAAAHKAVLDAVKAVGGKLCMPYTGAWPWAFLVIGERAQ